MKNCRSRSIDERRSQYVSVFLLVVKLVLTVILFGSDSSTGFSMVVWSRSTPTWKRIQHLLFSPRLVSEHIVSEQQPQIIDDSADIFEGPFQGFELKGGDDTIFSRTTTTAVEAITVLPAETLSTRTVNDVKSELLSLLSTMTGQVDELRRIEILVNELENLYQPVQTLDFLNLLQRGDWQLLFSTNRLSRGMLSSSSFRLRDSIQRISCRNRLGNFTTEILWDYASVTPGILDCTGTFTIESSYEMIPPGSRFNLFLKEHVLNNRGKTMPLDLGQLVGLLFRTIPKQLIDPTDHAVDITYLDGNLRILRYTGPKFEAVRDIWIRVGSLDISSQ